MAGKFHRLARINTERKETQMHDITITSATFEGATIPAVSARDLHAFLGVKRDFTSWIKGRIKQYGFVEGVDYLLTKTGEQLPSGTKYLSEYTITAMPSRCAGGRRGAASSSLPSQFPFSRFPAI